jgi:hypothetical protein
MFIFIFFKNSVHILEDNASCVKVGDIEQVLSKICLKMVKLHKIDGFLQSFVMMPSPV